MKICRCPTIGSSYHYMKVFKTKVKEYPLSNVWATNIKQLKFSESETEGNINIRAAVYNFLLFVCDFSGPSINYCYLCQLIIVQRYQYVWLIWRKTTVHLWVDVDCTKYSGLLPTVCGGIPFLCSICTFNQQPAGKDDAIKNAVIRIGNCTENPC